METLTTPAYRTISNHVIAEVRQKISNEQNALFSLRPYQPGEVIADFSAGTISAEPTYLTVQVGVGKHITLQPEFLQYINHSCDPNVLRREGLTVTKKQPPRRRLWLTDGSCPRFLAAHLNHVWTYDFVATRTEDERPVKLLTIVDEWVRECLSIDVARRLRSDDVLFQLAELFVQRGVPEPIPSDDDPEFPAKAVREWLHRCRGTDIVHYAGKPLGERGY